MKPKIKIYFAAVMMLAISGSVFFAANQARAEAEGTITNPFFEGVITVYVPDSVFCPAFINVINDSGDTFNFFQMPGTMDGYWDVFNLAYDPITNDPGTMIRGSMFPLTAQQLGLYLSCPVPIYPLVEAGTSWPPALSAASAGT